MKKFFTLVMALVAVMAVNATKVTLNPSDFSAATSAATSATVSGVTAAITSGTITADQIRIFKNQTITISCENAISGIVFYCTAAGDAQYGPGCFEAIDGYTVNNTIGTWIGSAASVAFKASSNQVRATAIEVYLDGEVPATDWKADTISVTQANALVAEGDKHDHFVVGVIMGAPFCVYDKEETVSFWMSDVENPTDSIEFFQGGAEGNTKWESLVQAQEILHKGDTVMVYAAQLQPYTKDDVTISEITGGYYAEMIGANPDPEEVVYPKLIVADALKIAKALEPERGKSASTKEIYAVYGYAKVKNAEDKTYFLTDEAGAYSEFQAYKCAEIDADVTNGDFVKVIGAISHFWGKSKEAPDDETQDYHNYEISGGYLYHADPSEAPEGIENVVLTEKAQKVMVNGVLYIVRDNKMFDVRGAQVR